MEDFIPRAEVKRAIEQILAEANDGGVVYGMAMIDRAVDKIPAADVVKRTELGTGGPTSVKDRLQRAREQIAEKAEVKGAGLYRCGWKEKTSPENTPCKYGFVKATDAKDAERIMRENLDSAYEVCEVFEAHASDITPQSLTVNFRNTAEYRLF